MHICANDVLCIFEPIEESFPLNNVQNNKQKHPHEYKIVTLDHEAYTSIFNLEFVHFPIGLYAWHL